MEHWFDWLNMGKHSFYVGLAYSAFFIAVALSLFLMVNERKRNIRQVKSLIKQKEQSTKKKPTYSVTDSKTDSASKDS